MTKQSNQNIPLTTVSNYTDFVLKDNRLIYVPTGEIIDNFDVLISFHKITERLHRENDVRDFYMNNWMGNTQFVKVYQINLRDFINKLTVYEKALLFSIIPYVGKTTTEILVEGKPPTNKVLSEISGIKNLVTLKSTLKSLVDNGYIYFNGSTSSRTMFINPTLIFNGRNLFKPTYDKFNPE